MRIRPEDAQIAVIPLSHSYGLSVLLMPLLLQGTAIVLRESFVPQQLPADAHHTGATRLPGVPFMFDYFVEHPPAEGWPERLTGVISAGARLSSDTATAFHRAFGVKIHGFYGTHGDRRHLLRFERRPRCRRSRRPSARRRHPELRP